MSNKQEMLYGICMVALALQLTAVCTEHWGVKSVTPQSGSGFTSGDVSLGLWKSCADQWNKQEYDADCMHLPLEGVKSFPKNSLYAARAFAIMGVILIFMGLMCMMYGKNYKRCQLVCLLTGGISSIIANVVWIAEMGKVKLDDSQPAFKFNPGYSFYLNLAGGLAGLAAAGYYYYGK